MAVRLVPWADDGAPSDADDMRRSERPRPRVCGWTRSRRLGKGREYLNPCRKEMSRAEWSSGVEVKVVRCSVAMVGEEESLVVSEGGRGAGASREQNDYQQLFRDSHLKNRIFVRDAIR